MNTKFNHFFKCGAEDCFKNNRFQNSVLSGNIDFVSYRGVSLQQRPDIADPFIRLIENTKPTNILEIGTAAGGLVLMLHDICGDLGIRTNIFTYDIITPVYLVDQITNRNINNIDVRVKNIFAGDYSKFLNEESKEEIVNIIKSDGPCLVLCDGASKIGEFNLIAPLLKSGDIIMAHDYSYSQEYFNQNIYGKVWNWCEIRDENIQQSIGSYNLHGFMRDNFAQVAWACFKKW